MSEMKVCATCREEKSADDFSANPAQRDGRRVSCRACDGARVKRWVKEHPERKYQKEREHQKRHPEKARARWRLQAAVREGRIAKPLTCERCLSTFEERRSIQGHHHDYDKPLEVEWLCRKCHAIRHREEAANAER